MDHKYRHVKIDTLEGSTYTRSNSLQVLHVLVALFQMSPLNADVGDIKE